MSSQAQKRFRDKNLTMSLTETEVDEIIKKGYEEAQKFVDAVIIGLSNEPPIVTEKRFDQLADLFERLAPNDYASNKALRLLGQRYNNDRKGHRG